MAIVPNKTTDKINKTQTAIERRILKIEKEINDHHEFDLPDFNTLFATYTPQIF